jgi:hypothetical protein
MPAGRFFRVPGVVTQDLEGWLKYAKVLEYSRDWEMRVVPKHVASTFRCPPARAK